MSVKSLRLLLCRMAVIRFCYSENFCCSLRVVVTTRLIVNSNQRSLIEIAICSSNVKRLIVSYRWKQIESFQERFRGRTRSVTSRRKQLLIPSLLALSRRRIQPFRHEGPRPFLQRYLQGGTADITENLLRNSDRQSCFWRCREHTDVKVSAESTSASLLPRLRRLPLVSPFRPLFLLIPRISCTLHIRSVLSSERARARSRTRVFPPVSLPGGSGRRGREQVSRRWANFDKIPVYPAHPD